MRENSLSAFFGVILLLTIVGQAFTGLAEYSSTSVCRRPAAADHRRVRHILAVRRRRRGELAIGYLQFLLYIVLTVWLVQKGSPESKPAGEEGRGRPQAEARPARDSRVAAVGTRRRLADDALLNSLGLVMGLFFLGSWAAQAGGRHERLQQRPLQNLLAPVSIPEYALSANFWNRTLQNWQSSSSRWAAWWS